ncbi:MAG: diguanylate cyclase [Janthinobacterium lividum]
MEHRGVATALAEPVATMNVGVGDLQLGRFDRIRRLLVETGLPPLPEVYDLLWRHAGDDDERLSRMVELAIAAGALSLQVVMTLRREYCGDVAAGDVTALVEAAHVQATRMTERLMEGRTDLAEYGRTIADSDAALNDGAPATPAVLAALIERLARATEAMLIANRRLEGELTRAATDAVSLRDRLRRAERASVTDPLTGLLNRRGVMELLAASREQAVGAGLSLTVALIDIDHFKLVNDRWGHVIGDEVLRHVARHLENGVAAPGAVGRLGGEEFIAVLPDVSVGGATAAIDGLRAHLAGQLIRRNSDGTSLGRVTFSAGVAADRPGDSAEALLGRADAALYAAKRLGRDRVIPDRT